MPLVMVTSSPRGELGALFAETVRLNSFLLLLVVVAVDNTKFAVVYYGIGAGDNVLIITITIIIIMSR